MYHQIKNSYYGEIVPLLEDVNGHILRTTLRDIVDLYKQNLQGPSIIKYYFLLKIIKTFHYPYFTIIQELTNPLFNHIPM